MRILVTGARAPICVDIVRALTKAGHQVWTADSMRFPVGRFSPASQGYIRLPAPRKNFETFASELVIFCKKFNIERIIPTSEEVFWLAAIKDLPETCQGFFPSREVLGQLHHKQTFAILAKSLGFGAAENLLFSTKAELDSFAASANLSKYVLKPIYSRFAASVLISPTLEQTKDIRPTAEAPWMAQTRAYGREVCLYNVAVDGKLIQHVAYTPKYRAGQGAGVYFEPVSSARLSELSERFIASTNFTGQISLDVIETDEGIVALECNPRGTSGVHLAVQSLHQFGYALVGKVGSSVQPQQPIMLEMPLRLYHPLIGITKSGRRALHQAKDAMTVAGVSPYCQALAMAELIIRALITRQSLLATATADIEWNGESIG